MLPVTTGPDGRHSVTLTGPHGPIVLTSPYRRDKPHYVAARTIPDQPLTLPGLPGLPDALRGTVVYAYDADADIYRLATRDARIRDSQGQHQFAGSAIMPVFKYVDAVLSDAHRDGSLRGFTDLVARDVLTLERDRTLNTIDDLERQAEQTRQRLAKIENTLDALDVARDGE